MKQDAMFKRSVIMQILCVAKQRKGQSGRNYTGWENVLLRYNTKDSLLYNNSNTVYMVLRKGHFIMVEYCSVKITMHINMI